MLHRIYLRYILSKFFLTINFHDYQRQNFSVQFQKIIKQTIYENEKKYQLHVGDL